MNGTGLVGDLGFAINLSTGEEAPFVVADIGPPNAPLGEVSISLAERLGGKNVNARTAAGAPRGEMLYVVFPYSSRTHTWPLAVDEIKDRTARLLRNAGGVDAILACKDVLQ